MLVGKHTLTFVNVNPAYSSTIDAVAVVDAEEFAAVLAERIGLLKALVLEKDYLGVYESETSYTELVRGVVTNDWGRNWSAYPSGGRSIRFSATQSSATIPIEAPVDGDYFVTARVNGLSQFSFLNLSVGSENMSFVKSFGLGGWTYLAYRVHLGEGFYNLTSSWRAQNTVWLDAVYVSSRMIPELVESRGARVLFRNIDDSLYSVMSFADQPCYLLLANSYFPLWKVSTSSGVKQPYLTNAFLMGFYVEGSNYTIRFG